VGASPYRDSLDKTIKSDLNTFTTKTRNNDFKIGSKRQSMPAKYDQIPNSFANNSEIEFTHNNKAVELSKGRRFSTRVNEKIKLAAQSDFGP
jgi:hypothetical protein